MLAPKSMNKSQASLPHASSSQDLLAPKKQALTPTKPYLLTELHYASPKVKDSLSNQNLNTVKPSQTSTTPKQSREALQNTFRNIKKADGVSLQLQKKDTRDWLQARFPNTKDFYLKTKAQLQAQYDVENVFYKFDYDNSGTMECRELQEMFAENGIYISHEECKQMFDFVDDTKAGCLNINKFKAFSKNKQANQMFKRIMKEIRQEKKATDSSGHPSQLPFNFNIMLEYLSNKEKMTEMWDDINDPYEKYAHDDTTFNKFKILFRHHVDNIGRDLVGTEELRSKLLKKVDIKEQEAMIKMKTDLERSRRKKLKQITSQQSILELLPRVHSRARNNCKALNEVARSRTQNVLCKREEAHTDLELILMPEGSALENANQGMANQAELKVEESPNVQREEQQAFSAQKNTQIAANAINTGIAQVDQERMSKSQNDFSKLANTQEKSLFIKQNFRQSVQPHMQGGHIFQQRESPTKNSTLTSMRLAVLQDQQNAQAQFDGYTPQFRGSKSPAMMSTNQTKHESVMSSVIQQIESLPENLERATPPLVLPPNKPPFSFNQSMFESHIKAQQKFSNSHMKESSNTFHSTEMQSNSLLASSLQPLTSQNVHPQLVAQQQPRVNQSTIFESTHHPYRSTDLMATQLHKAETQQDEQLQRVRLHFDQQKRSAQLPQSVQQRVELIKSQDNRKELKNQNFLAKYNNILAQTMQTQNSLEMKEQSPRLFRVNHNPKYMRRRVNEPESPQSKPCFFSTGSQRRHLAESAGKAGYGLTRQRLDGSIHGVNNSYANAKSISAKKHVEGRSSLIQQTQQALYNRKNRFVQLQVKDKKLTPTPGQLHNSRIIEGSSFAKTKQNKDFIKSARELQNGAFSDVKQVRNSALNYSNYELSGSVTSQVLRHIPRNTKGTPSTVVSQKFVQRELKGVRQSVPTDNVTQSFLTSQETMTCASVSPTKFRGKKSIQRKQY